MNTDNWHKCETQSNPKEADHYLVYIPGLRMNFSIAEYNGGRWKCTDGNPSHWCELPNPPKN